MKTQHFMVSGGAPIPERLHEAFPDLQVLTLAAWQSRVTSLSATQFLVWLNCADSQWPAQLQNIVQTKAAARVVLLSSAPEPKEGLGAINAGVRGYAHAYAVPALLQEVALVVEHGGLWVGPDLLQRLIGSTNAALASRSAADTSPAVAEPNAAWGRLSVREAQVARAVSEGRSNREVAAQLFISQRTVKAHLGAVFEKLGVRDRLQLVLHLATAGAPLPSTTTEPMT